MTLACLLHVEMDCIEHVGRESHTKQFPLPRRRTWTCPFQAVSASRPLARIKRGKCWQGSCCQIVPVVDKAQSNRLARRCSLRRETDQPKEALAYPVRLYQASNSSPTCGQRRGLCVRPGYGLRKIGHVMQMGHSEICYTAVGRRVSVLVLGAFLHT